MALTQSVPFLSAQLLAGLAILLLSGTWLVKSASRLAVLMGLSPTVIGLTIVAFGTSLPELVVSLLANFREGTASNLAIGNVVGSNITNISLILGVGAVIAVLPMEKTLLQREYPYMLFVSCLLVGFSWDGVVTRGEGVLLVAGLVLFMAYSYRAGSALNEDGDAAPKGGARTLGLNLLLLALSIAGLALGAQWLVASASQLARIAGISELFIGLSVVALGTSLPELVTTVIAIRRGEQAIAVGNLVGSNIFNVLAIVGITAAVKPLAAPASLLWLDYPVMLATSALPFLIAWFTRYRAGKLIGLPLLLCYVGYYAKLFFDASRAL